MSDTLTLQDAGWQISVAEDPSRHSLTIAMYHPQTRSEGFSDPINLRDLYQVRDNSEYFVQHINPDFAKFFVVRMRYLSNGVPLQVITHERFPAFRPIDATPQYTQIDEAPRSLSDLVWFAPVTRESTEMIVKPENISKILDMIREAQIPEQEQIRIRTQRRDLREQYERTTTHAQVVSLVA